MSVCPLCRQGTLYSIDSEQYRCSSCGEYIEARDVPTPEESEPEYVPTLEWIPTSEDAEPSPLASEPPEWQVQEENEGAALPAGAYHNRSKDIPFEKLSPRAKRLYLQALYDREHGR